MPRFFFYVFNGHGEIPDEEGSDLASHGAAHRIALDSIRSMIAEDARKGLIDLTGYIEVRDDKQQELMTVPYAEAFELRMPTDRSS